MSAAHDQALALEAARRCLLSFAVLQDPGYIIGKPHRLIADKLERVEAGEIDRLMIFAPPRHGKTRLSELFTAWAWGRDTRASFIRVGYQENIAVDSGKKTKRILMGPIHRAVFPGFGLENASNPSAKIIDTLDEGAFFAVGVGGPITGRGADYMIIDDPIKGQKDAQSETVRRHMQEWFQSVAYTRLSTNGALIVINTRWHEDDLSGWLLREYADDGWDVLALPAIDDEGEALWPERFPVEKLERIKKAVGSRVWSALYQQNPSPDGGEVWLRNWIQHWRALPTLERQIQSWDFSFGSTSDTASYVVGQVWGARGADRYLIDQTRARMGFPQMLDAVRALRAKHPQSGAAIYVEDAASGRDIIATLKREIPGVVPHKPSGSKVNRAQSVAPQWEAGNVWLPPASDAPWVADYIDEIVRFPYAKNDDQVDATSQALERLAVPAGVVRLTMV